MIKQSTPLSDIMKLIHPCDCDGCNHGCTMGSGMFTPDQIPVLAKFLNTTEEEVKKSHLEELNMFNRTMHRPKIERKNNMPFGKCIFFKDNKCSIHEVKPLQCKIAMACKPYGPDLARWFMHNHVINIKDKESMSQYQSYQKVGGKILKK